MDTYRILHRYIAYIRSFVNQKGSKILIMDKIKHNTNLQDLLDKVDKEFTGHFAIKPSKVRELVDAAESIARDVDKSVVIQKY
jgi:hypothetical protein